MIFLTETKLQSKNMDSVGRSCGFINGIDVDSMGASGGLSLGYS